MTEGRQAQGNDKLRPVQCACQCKVLGTAYFEYVNERECHGPHGRNQVPWMQAVYTPELGAQARGILPGDQNRNASVSVEGVTWQSGSLSSPGSTCQNLLRGAAPPVSRMCTDICAAVVSLRAPQTVSQ